MIKVLTRMAERSLDAMIGPSPTASVSGYYGWVLFNPQGPNLGAVLGIAEL